MTDIEWAINQLVHKKRGSSKQLADRLVCSQQILLNKVNPENMSNHLHLHEAMKLMQVTKDVSLLEVMAEQLGYKLVKNDCAAKPVVDALISAVKEQGDIASIVGSVVARGVVTQELKRAIRKEITEGVDSLDVLLSSIENVEVI